MLGQWVNDSEFAGAVRLNPKSKDPMIGAQDPAESMFVIPQTNGAPPIKITGFSSFTTTKAAAYCFLPSVTAHQVHRQFGISTDGSRQVGKFNAVSDEMFGVTGYRTASGTLARNKPYTRRLSKRFS